MIVKHRKTTIYSNICCCYRQPSAILDRFVYFSFCCEKPQIKKKKLYHKYSLAASCGDDYDTFGAAASEDNPASRGTAFL